LTVRYLSLKSKNGHIEVQAAYYSVPPRYVGTKVVVHIGRLWLRILDGQTHQLIREHAVTGRGQRRTIAADLPKQTPLKVLDLVARIAEFGPHCGAFAPPSRTNAARWPRAPCWVSST
jgi:hypothetical protein